jgi:uncharacterized protein
MLGTIINAIAVLIGTFIGIAIGNRLNKKVEESIMIGLGLVVLILGIKNAETSGNIIIPLLSIVAGAIAGETLDIDAGLRRIGEWLQVRFVGKSPQENQTVTSTTEDSAEISQAEQAKSRFIRGYITATLVFCVGPMSVIGAIQNGIRADDTQLLIIKSILDFFAAIAFASTLGIGVGFAAITIIVYQGGLALIGMLLASALTGGGALDASNPYLRELTATGGFLLIGLSLVLMNVRQVRVANYLPALIIALLLVAAATLLGINIYPL